MDCLIEFISKTDYEVDIPRNSISGLRRATVSYIFRIIGSTEYKKKLTTLLPTASKQTIINISRDILKNGYIMKNIKLWLYCLSYYDLTSSRKRKDIAKDFAVHDDDFILIKTIKDIPEIIKLHKFAAMELSDFDYTVGLTLISLKPYIGKFVNRKMRYIQMYHTMSASDLIGDLTCDALSVVMLYYPCIKSSEHLSNIMKVKIKNSGSNMMTWYGNTKRCVELCRTLGDSSQIDALIERDGAIVENEYVNNETVTKLMSMYSDKRKDFLFLIMNYDEKFSDWLRLKRNVKLPNDELLERGSSNKYIEYVLDYLKVDRVAAQPFIEKLKLMLA